VGRQRSAAAARWLVRRFSPQALLSFGFAGGLSPSLPRGTVIIGTEVVSASGFGRWPPASHNLIEQFQAAAAAAAVPLQQGTLVTSGHMAADVAVKAELWQKSGACAVDMETLGIVEAAAEVGLPWGAVRAITDTAAETVPAACLHMLRADGRVAVGRLFWIICRSPLVLRQLAYLARNSALAHRHLWQTFERWSTIQSGRNDHTPRTSLR
jgi:adenosylhomocysteine nucleosidase